MDFYNTTHISYNNAGIDTDTIVQKLMQAEQVPLNQLKQKQQKDLWLSDAYRQWNTDIFSFNNQTVFNMKMSASYDTYNVNSSQTNSLTGTASANAIPGTYNIKVNQLATSANLIGTKQNLSATATLSSLGVTTNSITLSVASDPSNPNSVKTATIKINPASDTITNLVSNINLAKDDTTGQSLGITAFYDSTLHQFMIKTNATGGATNIKLNPSDASFSSSLGIQGIDSKGNVQVPDSNGNFSASGQDANITFTNLNANTPPITTTSTSNTMNLMGVTYNLIAPTDSNGNGSTITVSRNVDTEVKNIEDFVSKYNDILGKLNTALSEPVYSDYQPLTDDQRSQMTDTQIQQWETKAKSGLMNSDSILSGLVTKMRSAMTSFVNNGSAYNSLASIGITSHSYQDQGKLYVDETKLRTALQNDPDGVKKLFSQLGTGVGNQGIVQSLSDSLMNAFTQLVTKAGSTSGSQYDQSFLGKDLTSLQTQISGMTTKLQAKENSYYKQYDAMQQAVSKYQSQGSWLSQQLGTTSTTG